MSEPQKLYCIVYIGYDILNKNKLGQQRFYLSSDYKDCIDQMFDWELHENKTNGHYDIFMAGPGDSEKKKLPMSLSCEYSYTEAIKEAYRYIWQNSLYLGKCEVFVK